MLRLLPFIAFVLFSIPTMAGDLFPPQGSVEGANGKKYCAGRNVLVWTGDGVVCEPVNPMVEIQTCPDGQYMKGISNGQPVCENLAPRIRSYINGNCKGQDVHYGVVQNVNAGVLTLNSSHLNGGTQFVGNLLQCK